MIIVEHFYVNSGTGERITDFLKDKKLIEILQTSGHNFTSITVIAEEAPPDINVPELFGKRL